MTQEQVSIEERVVPKKDFEEYKKFLDGRIFWREELDGTVLVRQSSPDKYVSNFLRKYPIRDINSNKSLCQNNLL